MKEYLHEILTGLLVSAVVIAVCLLLGAVTDDDGVAAICGCVLGFVGVRVWAVWNEWL